MKLEKNNFIKDLSWYLLGSTLPLLVGFFRIPIFTRYFTTSEYGTYGIILITFTILSIFLYNWVSNCIWRFYNKFKNEKRLPEFYSNLLVLYFISAVVFALVSIFWNIQSDIETNKKLIILIFLQLSISSLNNYFLAIQRLEEQTVRFNTITILRAILTFGVQYFLTFILGYRIEAIPISFIVVEIIFLIYLTYIFFRYNKIFLPLFSLNTSKLFLDYAIPGILSNLGLYILTSSDRYFIALFWNIDEVGIYNQIYNLSQVSIMALINVFFSVINPGFMRNLEHNFKATSRITNLFLRNYIILIAPITVYFGLFAYYVAQVLLGPSFRVGYMMIPWISTTSFIYGLTLFSENRIKFKSQYKTIIVGFFTCSILNIILNLIGIPIFGYTFAAVSTLISYSVLFFYFLLSDIKQNNLKISLNTDYISVLITLVTEVISYFLIVHYFNIDLSLTQAILLGIAYLLLYIAAIAVFNRRTLILFARYYNK